MIVRTLPVGMIQTNCYVVGCEETHKAVVIDPGGDADVIVGVVESNDLDVLYVLNTHCHFDHIGANSQVLAATGAKLALHPAEIPALQSGGGAALFGIPLVKSPDPDVHLRDGQSLTVGSLCFEVLLTPGHSPGGVSFYVAEERAVFVGDTLFSGGVGRTDLPGGNPAELMVSIQNVLFVLPSSTVVYPGHGPATTIDREKRTNPWV